MAKKKAAKKSGQEDQAKKTRQEGKLLKRLHRFEVRGSNRDRSASVFPVNEKFLNYKFITTVFAPAPTWAPKREEPFPATAEGFFFFYGVIV